MTQNNNGLLKPNFDEGLKIFEQIVQIGRIGDIGEMAIALIQQAWKTDFQTSIRVSQQIFRIFEAYITEQSFCIGFPFFIASLSSNQAVYFYKGMATIIEVVRF